MDIDALLTQYLTDGIIRNTKKHVGLELEFPIVAADGGDVCIPALQSMMTALARIGYRATRFAKDGTPLYVKDEAGNAVTFDTCYENLEYVSASAPSMLPVYRRFRETLKAVQRALMDNGHMLLGIGYNPVMRTRTPQLVESELTLAIDRFFRGRAAANRRYKDFYSMISSEQIHFNTTPAELPALFEAFTRLDWMNILLFSDSPATLNGTRFHCARNELYMRSSFGELGLVGAQDENAQTVLDIARGYRKLGLFMRKRDGRTELFAPVTVEEYFSDPAYGATPEDIHSLDIERNIVTTSYGTVEYRMLCSQPFDEAFVPSAFCLGLRVMLNQTLALAKAFDAEYHLPAPNARNEAASRGMPGFAPSKAVHEYAKHLLALSYQGLTARGFGEERFLAPLYARKSIFDSPAARFEHELKHCKARDALLLRANTGKDIIE